MTLHEALGKITPVEDAGLRSTIQNRLDNLTKPLKSLGRLEELAMQYAMIKRTDCPVLRNKAIYVFAGDHGIAEEGVSAYPKDVTFQMVYNFLNGGAGINVLARHIGADVYVVDMGVDHLFEDAKGLINRKISMGTRNMRHGPAMTEDECIKALEAGIEIARQAAELGVDITGTGDMGIGNTTPSAAITSLFTGMPVVEVTGRGTGIDDDTYKHKIRVIEESISINRPDPDDPVDVLTKVGGYEIAGIAGFIIGAASLKIPVVIDGFISSASALVAVQFKEEIREYLFASHMSVEKGHRAILNRMGLTPLLDLSLRLGEGTGACLGINLVEAGVKILTEMATFSEAGVSSQS